VHRAVKTCCMQHATCNKAYYNCNKTCNAATQWAGARAQPVKAVSVTGSERRSTDGAAAYWRPSKYSWSGKLPRDWLHLVTKCIILSMYLIMHNSSATVLAVLSFRFYCSCNRGFKRRVLEKKLILRANRKSYIRNRLVPK